MNLKALLACAAALVAAAPAHADNYVFRMRSATTAPSGNTPSAPTLAFQTVTGNPNGFQFSNPVDVTDLVGQTVSYQGTGDGYHFCAKANCSDMPSWGYSKAPSVVQAAKPYIRVTQRASATYGGTSAATVTIGSRSGSFQVVTRQMKLPLQISFQPVSDAEPGSFVMTEPQNLGEFDPVDVSVVGDEAGYRVCSDVTCETAVPFFITSGKEYDYDPYIQFRMKAPAAGTTATGKLRYGNLEAPFSVTSR